MPPFYDVKRNRALVALPSAAISSGGRFLPHRRAARFEVWGGASFGWASQRAERKRMPRRSASREGGLRESPTKIRRRDQRRQPSHDKSLASRMGAELGVVRAPEGTTVARLEAFICEKRTWVCSATLL